MVVKITRALVEKWYDDEFIAQGNAENFKTLSLNIHERSNKKFIPVH